MTLKFHDHSRWGSADQAGAANLLTAEKRLQAIRGIETGRLFDLSHVIETGAPRYEPYMGPYVISSWATWRDGIRRRRALGATNDAGTNLERIEMTTHVGTHIDALGHFTIGEEMYNGNNADEVVTDYGLEKLGIENAPPMITRGICLDVSSFDGDAFLEVGRVVTRGDLERAVENARAMPEPGDVVVINTGWGRFYMTDNERYLSGEPGIDEEAARWLTERGVTAIGCDNMGVEVRPGVDERILMPVHQHCLVETGVYLVENLVLDALVRERVTSFCIFLLAVKFKGATGCPVRAVAMV